MEWLKGKKTYLVGAAGAVVIGLHLMGFIEGELTSTILGALGFTGLVTLRAGVASSTE